MHVYPVRNNEYKSVHVLHYNIILYLHIYIDVFISDKLIKYNNFETAL